MVHKHKRKFAVFDIDGTIFRSSLLIELVEELIRARVFPRTSSRGYVHAHRKWLDRKGSYEAYINAVVRVFDRNIGGVREKDFLPVVRTVVRKHRNRVYRYTRDLVHTLKRQGYYLLAISHSPKYIVGKFGAQLGFDKVYGRLLELNTRTRRFTGKGIYEEIIFDKAKVLERAAEKEQLTIRGSVGVGDTESDIPMLRLVEQPICFNPNAKLFRTAKQHGWKVVIERKDTIYEIRH